MLPKLILLILMATAVFTGYAIYQLISKKVSPRQSAGYFLLYIVLNLLSVLLVTFIFGFIIIQFKEFFIRK
jgi:formate/nitrite transporter FocA (FNT family)